jgi:hypothetical protein
MTEPTTGRPDARLEEALAAVDQRLAALGEALRTRDLAGVDTHASALHAALAQAVDCFARAAKNGPLPHALRLRLASTSGLVAAQRESLARATAALDRAMDVLLPREAPAVYSAGGAAARSLGGNVQA